MKALLALLILSTFSPFQADEITQKDFVGKWKVVSARITDPTYCGPWESGSIIDSTLEFTDDGILILTSSEGIERTNRTKPSSWTFEDNKLTFKSGKTVKPQVIEITKIGETIFFRPTNMVELGIEKE